MQITSDFECGNIQICSLNGNFIKAKIKTDQYSKDFQWFYFKIDGCKNAKLHIDIVNASEASFPDGWYDYSALASYDDAIWFRVDTTYDGKTLTIKFTPECDKVYFAYFEPYKQKQHTCLVKRLKATPYFLGSYNGRSVEGRTIDVIRLGLQTSVIRKKIWMIARQHPGETMAEWFVEGIVDQIEANDEEIRRILNAADIYLIPNLNPDGSALGSQRSNAAGINLNREWVAPSVERSPEIKYVKGLIEQTGIDLFLDVHGEETLPYAFVMGCEGVPSYNAQAAERERQFKNVLLKSNFDFQDDYGYPKKKKGEADLTMASNYIGETYRCLSLTIEMPYKDCKNNLDPDKGWTVLRSKALSKSVILAIDEFICLQGNSSQYQSV
ncbi:M14-type cytosolic carboxypeptidase [Dendronalium sp. ChiSLP03b]|uniref:M14 family metallopeptidase n=1 Tax=Dendronalium sp. ChiSLP03b TaxID=3075381 RepID=UPI002AD46662|nr:M14-type cytosolic carboxypeptidase [Dendronalium sp. ChiSLP03b]MDZ8206776.1 M14-type cytosolic carboxypeptidase [Dendronalium sp. ChiSLP03b]